MYDDMMKRLLGAKHELLSRPSIYMKKEEKWSLLQALLFSFGARVVDDRISLPFREFDKRKVHSLAEAVESLLNIRLQVEENAESDSWEISVIP
jgi:hypothetical protein